MKLHTVFITYNRLELTKRAIASYLETVNVPYSLWVVDNGSDLETRLWLSGEWWDRPFPVEFLSENRYPGYATNYGWGLGPPDATHLHRADNDFIFLPGWCEEVERMFEAKNLGQLGMRTDEEELFVKTNVGGNCVVRRELWDYGLRWDERPWPQLSEEVGQGWTEDSLMSQQVKNMGYYWDRVERPCIQPISVEDPDDEYYIQTWADRGIKR